jgi:hypothetical protein
MFFQNYQNQLVISLECFSIFLNSHSSYFLNLVWMQATTPEYRGYQEQVLSNCTKFAQV